VVARLMNTVVGCQRLCMSVLNSLCINSVFIPSSRRKGKHRGSGWRQGEWEKYVWGRRKEESVGNWRDTCEGMNVMRSIIYYMCMCLFPPLTETAGQRMAGGY